MKTRIHFSVVEVDVFYLSEPLLNKFAWWKVRGRIQIRSVRQKRSIKRNIELPVAIREARDGQRSGWLSSLLCLTRKHNVSLAKDKERLIRLTFQGCFLVSLIISLAFYLYHDYIFFFSYSIHCLYSRSYSGSYSIFPLFFVYNLNRN